MARKEVNPDMELTKGSVPNPSSPRETGKKSGGRKEINPDMDLQTSGIGTEANTGGKIDTGKREAINPDMDLSKGGASAEGTMQEQSPAVMPGVGNMPTGKKAANKSTQRE